MKKILLFVTVLILSFPYFACSQNSSKIQEAFKGTSIRILDKPRDPIDFRLPLLNGEMVSLSDYKGKVVLLNFWATWCPPCRVEMPSMETLYHHFKDQGFEILAVNLGEDAAHVQQFMDNNNHTFPVLLDRDEKVGALYGIRAIPTSYIIDRSGKIVGSLSGAIYWDRPDVISAFETLLK